MESSTHNLPQNKNYNHGTDAGEEAVTKSIAPEFDTWPMTEGGVEAANKIRGEFDRLLTTIEGQIPTNNGRYLALVKTKLEEACLFAVKGVAKPN